MRSARAIFIKQLRDVIKNKMVLFQFIIFPLVAFIMNELVAKADETMPDNIFALMFSVMFAGMTPLFMTNTVIAEDKERKSLRFLVMAGVKPHEYLLGIGGFILTMCSFVSFVFALICGFEGMDLLKFVSVLILGSCASAMLGAIIGIISKNQQAAAATGAPVFMILAFSPVIASINKTVEKMTSFLFTHQVNLLVNDLSMYAAKPFLIILANMAVLSVLFVIAYRKKGLRN